MPTLKLFPISTVTYTSAGTTFLNPDNIKADDGLYCEITSTAALSSDNIGGVYDFTQIPENAIVTGVTVEAKVYASNAAQSGGLWFNNQWDYLAGTWWTNLPTTPTVLIHDDMPVHNWTREMLVTNGEWNITAFIHEKDDNTTQRKVYVDYIAVNITYDLPAANDDRVLESLVINDNTTFNVVASRSGETEIVEPIAADLDIYQAVKNSLRILTTNNNTTTSFQILTSRENDVSFNDQISKIIISNKANGSGVDIQLKLKEDQSGIKSTGANIDFNNQTTKQLTVIPNKNGSLSENISESLNITYSAASRMITISVYDSEYIAASKGTRAEIKDDVQSNFIISTVQSKVKNIVESLKDIVNINSTTGRSAGTLDQLKTETNVNGYINKNGTTTDQLTGTVIINSTPGRNIKVEYQVNETVNIEGSSKKYAQNIDDKIKAALTVNYNSILSVIVNLNSKSSIDIDSRSGRSGAAAIVETVKNIINHIPGRSGAITETIEKTTGINSVSSKYSGIKIPLKSKITLDEPRGVKFKLTASIDTQHRKANINALNINYRGQLLAVYRKSVYRTTADHLKVEKKVSSLKTATGIIKETLTVDFDFHKDILYKMPTLKIQVPLKEFKVKAIKQNKKVKGVKRQYKIKGVL